MFHISNSNVFVEIGEAIGNVARRLVRHHSQAEILDETYHRLLQDPPRLRLPERTGETEAHTGTVIEGTFHVIEKEDR
jgi:hypothetical protein